MSKRLARNLIAVLIVVCVLALMVVLGGCARVEVHRNMDGSLDATYWKLATKMDQPVFSVSKTGEDTYTVKFNAEAINESASADTLATSVGKVLEQGGSVSATVPEQ